VSNVTSSATHANGGDMLYFAGTGFIPNSTVWMQAAIGCDYSVPPSGSVKADPNGNFLELDAVMIQEPNNPTSTTYYFFNVTGSDEYGNPTGSTNCTQVTITVGNPPATAAFTPQVTQPTSVAQYMVSGFNPGVDVWYMETDAGPSVPINSGEQPNSSGQLFSVNGVGIQGKTNGTYTYEFFQKDSSGNTTVTANATLIIGATNNPGELDPGTNNPIYGGGTPPAILGTKQVCSGPLIFFASTVNMQGDYGTIEAPNLQTSAGCIVAGVPQGAEIWAMTPEVYQAFLYAISEYPWISTNIQQIWAFPQGFVDLGSPQAMNMSGQVNQPLLREQVFYRPTNGQSKTFHGFTPIASLLNNLPLEYQKVKKLLTYPFSVIELNGPDGNSTYYKPELLSSASAQINYVSNPVLPFARIGFWIPGYGNNGATPVTVNQSWEGAGGIQFGATLTYDGDTLDSALWFSNWPQLSLLNNSYELYAANTAYTRAYSYANAGWQKDLGTRNYQTQFNNAMTNANAGMTNSVIGAVGDFGADIARGGLKPGGIIGGIIQGVSNVAQGAVSYGAAVNVADNNQALAQFAVSGDYQMAIMGINAAVQQAQIAPPSQSGNRAGDGFGLGAATTTLRLMIKSMVPNFIHIVGDYFLRFGIAIQEFMQLPSNLGCMTKFSYWKCQNVNITSSFGSDTDRQVLSGILEKGVTIWNDPSYIGRTALSDNEIVPGYSY